MLFLAYARVRDDARLPVTVEQVAQMLDASGRFDWEQGIGGLVQEVRLPGGGVGVIAVLDATDEASARTALAALAPMASCECEVEVVPFALGDGSPRRLDGLQLVAERAVAWALERVGSLDYALRCLSFVEDAYERPNGIEVYGGDCARESAARYGAAGEAANAPRGAFVFFATRGIVGDEVRDWGHVGLALGDGRMVHAWPDVRVDRIEEIASLPAGGWTPPQPIGWASPAVIVTGARAALLGARTGGTDGSA